MLTLKHLDGLVTSELECLHDYLSRGRQPNCAVFRKAALDVLCLTEQEIIDNSSQLRHWELMSSILVLLYDRP